MASTIPNVDPSYDRKLARLPKAFSYQELKNAINDFSDMLGEGGFGSVFKGRLEDRTPIAVKRINVSDKCKIFYEGEVLTIASLHHKNLVRLQGFCSHEIETGGYSYIVYNLLQKGSLDTWIFSKEGRPNYQVLSWKQRYQVAIDVAKALMYLHDNCTPQIIHCDVKPANILLDDDFGGVLADFGLSVMTKKDGIQTRSLSVRGTRGYIAPEMTMNYGKSSKSDMYSFGKVLLDMFFGIAYVCLDINGYDIFKKDGNTLTEERTFHKFLRGKLKNNKIMDLVDNRLKKDVTVAEANTLVDVALRCVEHDPSRRPLNMQMVLQLLEQGQQDQHEYGVYGTHIEKDFSSSQVLKENPYPVAYYAPPQPVLVKRSETFSSQQSAKQKILTALKDNQVNMVGVYGMGGVGKTTLMSQIIQDTEISSQFENVLMVTISQNRTLEDIQTEIAEKLGMKFYETSVTVKAMRLSAWLKQAKSLVILDDMWKELSLEDVGIPLEENDHGCKVVMTTRRLNVCTGMDAQAIVEVQVLEENESWELFCQNTGKDIDSNEIQSLAKTIVQECKGLPLAIIVLAKALKGKKRDLWDAALQQLKRSACKDISTALSSIRWSYDYLESKDTKFCFLLCCLFSEDYEISMDQLLMYAVGEDILADADTLAEARGRLLQIVENLISSSLLLKCDASKFMMHDIVRDAAISIASENGNNFIVKAGMGLCEWPQLKDVRHILRLSLISNDISVLPNQLNCQRLVTLSLARNYNLQRVSDEFFTGMTAVTILDLSSTCISSLPQSLSTLTNLRTLNLQGCRSLVDLSMLGCLKNLEILNLSKCRIWSLPEEFKSLTNLKLLDLSGNYCLGTIPPNVISSLSRLEELYIYEFSNWESEGMEERKNACLSELSSLTSLSALHMHTKDVSLLYRDLPFQWKNLKEFKIAFSDEFFAWGDYCSNSLSISSVDDITSIAEWVRGLWGRNDFGLNVSLLHGIPNIIPLLHSSFNNLKYLEISYCSKMEYLVKTEEIGEQAILMELEELRLYWMSVLKGICSSGPIPIGFFNKLISLEVFECDELVNVFPVSMVESLPQLESLEIYKCKKMVQICSSGPIPIGSFNKLKDIRVDRCDELVNVFPVSMVESLPQLESLEIYKCKKMVQICSSGPIPIGSLNKLKSLKVEECDGMVNAFPVSMAESLTQLESLLISRCKRMVQIFGSEEEGCSQSPKIKAVFSQLKILYLEILPNLSKFSSQSSVIFSFPTLEIVCIRFCPNLRRVPLGPQLMYLTIGYCNQMVQIFGSEEEGCSQPPKIKVVFSQLKKLYLENLPNLSRFSSQSSVIFSFPSLEKVTIRLCPNLTRVPLGPESAPKVKVIYLKSDEQWHFGEDQSFSEMKKKLMKKKLKKKNVNLFGKPPKSL